MSTAKTGEAGEAVRVEVKYDGPGGWAWRAATVVETVPGLPGHARVVFDDPPTPHPSWWASPENIREPHVAATGDRRDDSAARAAGGGT